MISESDRCDLYTGLGRGGPQRRDTIVVKLAGVVELLGKFRGGESAYVEPTVSRSILRHPQAKFSSRITIPLAFFHLPPCEDAKAKRRPARWKSYLSTKSRYH